MHGSIRIGRPILSLAAAVLGLAVLAGTGAALQDCTQPTVPTLRKLRQPDGHVVELYFRGNGFRHWYEDPAGFPVVKTVTCSTYSVVGSGGSSVMSGNRQSGQRNTPSTYSILHSGQNIPRCTPPMSAANCIIIP